jgi:hypothetical protein
MLAKTGMSTSSGIDSSTIGSGDSGNCDQHAAQHTPRQLSLISSTKASLVQSGTARDESAVDSADAAIQARIAQLTALGGHSPPPDLGVALCDRDRDHDCDRDRDHDCDRDRDWDCNHDASGGGGTPGERVDSGAAAGTIAPTKGSLAAMLSRSAASEHNRSLAQCDVRAAGSHSGNDGSGGESVGAGAVGISDGYFVGPRVRRETHVWRANPKAPGSPVQSQQTLPTTVTDFSCSDQRIGGGGMLRIDAQTVPSQPPTAVPARDKKLSEYVTKYWTDPGCVT